MIEDRRRKWQRVCREFRASGVSRNEFCARHGIALSTLSYRLHPQRFGSAGQALGKRPGGDLVPVGTVSRPGESTLRVRIAERLVVELELPCEESVIRQVLRAAASL